MDTAIKIAVLCFLGVLFFLHVASCLQEIGLNTFFRQLLNVGLGHKRSGYIPTSWGKSSFSYTTWPCSLFLGFFSVL